MIGTPLPNPVPNPPAPNPPVPTPNVPNPPVGTPPVVTSPVVNPPVAPVPPRVGTSPQGFPPKGFPPQGYVPPQGGQPRSGINPATGAAIGAAAVVGGFLAVQGIRGLGQVREQRQEYREGNTVYFNEPGRQIEQRDNQYYIRHDENERFRELGLQSRHEQRGNELVSIYDRPDGEQIVTVTDPNGRLIRRIRRFRDGREVIIIDNGLYGAPRPVEQDIVLLPPPRIEFPRERYIVDAGDADEGLIYETLAAPPVQAIPRRYTLDQVRYSPNLRAQMRSVDVNTINFDSGAWAVSPDQTDRLATIAAAIKRTIQNSPNEVFLVEGYTDAVGSEVDNLSLSDRRAQSVAEVLTRNFGVPPENLTTQGYGEQYLKVQTQGASRENRRVTLRRITPLLGGQAVK